MSNFLKSLNYSHLIGAMLILAFSKVQPILQIAIGIFLNFFGKTGVAQEIFLYQQRFEFLPSNIINQAITVILLLIIFCLIVLLSFRDLKNNLTIPKIFIPLLRLILIIVVFLSLILVSSIHKEFTEYKKYAMCQKVVFYNSSNFSGGSGDDYVMQEIIPNILYRKYNGGLLANEISGYGNHPQFGVIRWAAYSQLNCTWY
ncbi:MAG: hypothetical protein H7230_04715 [Candidatus Parcubacteria bacterium]|nr:hypothetical protein [Candidatus Paceibacterota bacterium]